MRGSGSETTMNSAMVESNAVAIPAGFILMRHLTGRDLLLMTQYDSNRDLRYAG